MAIASRAWRHTVPQGICFGLHIQITMHGYSALRSQDETILKSWFTCNVRLWFTFTAPMWQKKLAQCPGTPCHFCPPTTCCRQTQSENWIPGVSIVHMTIASQPAVPTVNSPQLCEFLNIQQDSATGNCVSAAPKRTCRVSRRLGARSALASPPTSTKTTRHDTRHTRCRELPGSVETTYLSNCRTGHLSWTVVPANTTAEPPIFSVTRRCGVSCSYDCQRERGGVSGSWRAVSSRSLCREAVEVMGRCVIHEALDAYVRQCEPVKMQI